MASQTASAAKKRLHRFLFGDPDRTDLIASLPRRRQETLADLAYAGNSREASAKLAQWERERAQARSTASKKAAATRFETRRARAVDKILRAFGRDANPRTVRRNSYLWDSKIVREIESRPVNDMQTWVINQARRRVKPGETNPLWYR